MKKNLFGLSLICVLLFLISGIILYSFLDHNKISQKEKRVLSPKPKFSVKEWFSKSYSTKLDAFLSDHVYGRDALVKQAKRIEESMKYWAEVEYVSGLASTRQDVASDVIILQDRILMIYRRDPQAIKGAVEAFTALFNMVPDGIDKYLFISPMRIEFENGDFKKYSDPQKSDIDLIYNALPKSINLVDVYSSLNGKDIDKTFFRTDHHWTHLGAFYAANAILTASKKGNIDIKHYQAHRGHDFLGHLGVKYKASSLEAHRDELVYYTDEDIPRELIYFTDADGNTKSKESMVIDPSRTAYYTFVSEIYQYVVIEGKNKQGGCLLFVADSFGSALGPWLAEKYAKVIILDPRFFKGGKPALQGLLSRYQVTDFMLGECMMTVVPGFTAAINRLNDVSEAK